MDYVAFFFGCFGNIQEFTISINFTDSNPTQWQDRKGLIDSESFPKNHYFLPPDRHTYVFVSGGQKYDFFGKFYVRTK